MGLVHTFTRRNRESIRQREEERRERKTERRGETWVELGLVHTFTVPSIVM